VVWQAGLESATPFVFFPVIIHAFDVLVSSIAIMLVGRGSEGEPMAMLMRGYFVSLVLAAIGFLFATWWLLSSDKYPGAWFNFFGCGVVGMITAYVFARSSQYYTDYAYEPVRTARWAVGMGVPHRVCGGSWCRCNPSPRLAPRVTALTSSPASLSA